MTPNDVKIVADNIDDFIEVFDGIERLRKAVLTLAVAGKLVAQDKKEGTAEDLYSKIQEEKSVVSNKKKRKEVFLIDQSEILFEIPETWKWVRLSEISSIFNGNSINKHEKELKYKGAIGIPYIGTKDVGFDHIINYESGVSIPKTELSNFKIASKDSVFVCAEGGSAGRKVAHLEQDVFFGNKLFAIHPPSILDSKYIFYYCISSEFYNSFQSAMSGLIGGVSINKFGDLLLPLPPSGEQKRIVKKVEEVMKQLDDLEIKKLERDETRTRLARSAMQSLSKGESKTAFEHLTDLVRTPSDLKELEGALLKLAISGQLLSQNKKDGTGEDLFNKIQLSKAKVKKQITIEDKDKLFPIPSSWSWVRLEDVFDVRDGTHDSPKYHTSGYPLITSKNLYYGKLDFLNVKYVSEIDYKKINERSKVDRDDILFAMIGSIGNPVIVDTDAEFSIKNVALFKYYSRELSEPNFLLTYLKYASQNMRAISAGGVQSFVSLGFLRGYPFPLPPLAEQKRIVKKVEEIMVLIDRLKQVIG